LNDALLRSVKLMESDRSSANEESTKWSAVERVMGRSSREQIEAGQWIRRSWKIQRCALPWKMEEKYGNHQI
jgi:hypothetical protein